MKTALITGVNGQDGSYLAELLLSKGYEVHGTIRRSSFENSSKFQNIAHLQENIHLHPVSIEEGIAIHRLIKEIIPDECYHLAAQSFVDYSFNEENAIMATNFNSTLHLLASILEVCPDCRFYFAGSSEMFGEPDVCPQNEMTRFNPKSIYGITKISSYYAVKYHREHNGLFACTGITYNHESPRRGYQFVTRKITSTLARIAHGDAAVLELGNLDAIRDWGWAPDYVEAMWLMLNSTKDPADYVIATGKGHTVREFLSKSLELLDLDFDDTVRINQNYFRAPEKIPLIGDPSKIGSDIGWISTKRFDDIVKEMVEADLRHAGSGMN